MKPRGVLVKRGVVKGRAYRLRSGGVCGYFPVYYAVFYCCRFSFLSPSSPFRFGKVVSSARDSSFERDFLDLDLDLDLCLDLCWEWMCRLCDRFGFRGVVEIGGRGR